MILLINTIAQFIEALKRKKKKPTDVTSDSYAECNEDFNKMILNLMLVAMLEFQNTKTFLLKDTLQIG